MTAPRHELKYQINSIEYQVLKKKLSTTLKLDPNTYVGCRYNVKSIYFDDFEDTAFFDKDAGVYNRKKYRIRIYNHSDSLIKFERKLKKGQFTIKESSVINREQAERLLSQDYSLLENAQDPLLKSFYLETKCKLLHPVVVVEYDREAYVEPVGNVRATFDTCLRTSIGATCFFENGKGTMGIMNQQGIIMEVKYNEVLPLHIRGLFPDTIRPKLSIGKFSLCRTQQMWQTGNSLAAPSFIKRSC